MYRPRLWTFVEDMDYSGSVTISDVWLWFKWLYFYPGDLFVYFLLYKVPEIGQFFEMSYESYGGFFSGIISFFAWGIICLFCAGLIEVVTELKKDIADFWNEKIRKRSNE